MQTEKKIKELMELLKDLRPRIYTTEDEGYEELEETDHCIYVQNKKGNEDLYILIEEEGFTLSVGDWDSHYEAEEADYQNMLKELKNFLSGKSYLIMVYSRDEWICSLSIKSTMTDIQSIREKIRKFLYSAGCEPLYKEICTQGAVVSSVYWDGSKDNEIELPPSPLTPA